MRHWPAFHTIKIYDQITRFPYSHTNPEFIIDESNKLFINFITDRKLQCFDTDLKKYFR